MIRKTCLCCGKDLAKTEYSKHYRAYELKIATKIFSKLVSISSSWGRQYSKHFRSYFKDLEPYIKNNNVSIVSINDIIKAKKRDTKHTFHGPRDHYIIFNYLDIHILDNITSDLFEALKDTNNTEEGPYFNAYMELIDLIDIIRRIILS